MAKDIWLVGGDRGSYSDHEEWVVAVFSTESAAQTYAEICKKQYESVFSETKRSTDNWYMPENMEKRNAILTADPKMKDVGCYSDDVRYYVWKVQLDPEVPVA